MRHIISVKALAYLFLSLYCLYFVSLLSGVNGIFAIACHNGITCKYASAWNVRHKVALRAAKSASVILHERPHFEPFVTKARVWPRLSEQIG